ncbi:ATP-binding protein [Altericroceibacterium spongiae]|uniref:ATP-binding protein n=1 Tax=Altericroceibacterium spongiae TaxID=2320269 RepID=A0A420ECC5_9SPHN|nr:ATP-binding protein [Altericroceibacterium spongiae]RKF18292.1 ATP-binding protein [Altericroceibacterium spongiae]
MDTSIVIGADNSGKQVTFDIEELLATRLLVQGNSGSGKSHLLRRLLEESAEMVQQVVIDPEGDFVTLADPFGHVVIDGATYGDREIAALAVRIREHRASVILALDELEIEQQMRCAAIFLSALFDAPREHWFPVLVVVDEAQMFAPASGGEVAEETRRLSLSAMTNLMCRGRKRGLAGIIATQRLAKLAKNVAAEASNFLMGRTFLDIDMVRAADLLGMERRQAEQIRDLERGRFLALGPAICRRPVAVKIGDVRTSSRAVASSLIPPPSSSTKDMEALLMAELEELTPPPPPLPPQESREKLEERITSFAQIEEDPESPAPSPEESQSIIDDVLRELAQEEGATYQAASGLYQDFTVRCRMRRVSGTKLGMTEFHRRFAYAVGGLHELDEARQDSAKRLGKAVPEDLLAPFMLIVKAALLEESCPDDDRLAYAYGTSSSGRIRRLLDHFEKNGLIVMRTDFGGRRTITVPQLGVTTAAG